MVALGCEAFRVGRYNHWFTPAYLSNLIYKNMLVVVVVEESLVVVRVLTRGLVSCVLAARLNIRGLAGKHLIFPLLTNMLWRV